MRNGADGRTKDNRKSGNVKDSNLLETPCCGRTTDWAAGNIQGLQVAEKLKYFGMYISANDIVVKGGTAGLVLACVDDIVEVMLFRVLCFYNVVV